MQESASAVINKTKAKQLCTAVNVKPVWKISQFETFLIRFLHFVCFCMSPYLCRACIHNAALACNRSDCEPLSGP